MKKEGLKNEKELQSYFTKQMEKIIAEKDRKIVGWDEILEGGIPPSATIMSWRGEKGGIVAANAGHNVIMTPDPILYLDTYQGSPLCEPVKIGGLETLQMVYKYNPIPKEIKPSMVHHIIGLQGNLWSEYLFTPNECDYQLFPRALAIAETGWTKPAGKNLKDFIRRLNDQQIRLDEHDINYYIPMPEGNLNYMEFTKSLLLSFKTNRLVRVVYTTDGTTPNVHSRTYKKPVLITKTTTLKLRSVLPQGKMSPVRTIYLTKVKPLSPVKIKDPQKGLRLRYVKQGYYTYASQLQKVRHWKDTVVSRQREFFRMVPTYTDTKSLPIEPRGAAIFKGYIHITQPGLYKVHYAGDELMINNQLLINNDGKIKKYVPTDITVPFEAGYYPVKMIVLNNIMGGWPGSWTDHRIKLSKWEGTNTKVKLRPVPVFYTK